MMSFKLAFRNVKKSLRDYAIYFLTLTFGVCLFYVFNSIESQQVMMIISKSQSEALESLNRLMGIVSTFISFIFGFLILYANRFLIKRRKKELGIYMTLGMQKGQISRILIIETAFVGIFSLLAGLLLGVFLSQGLAVVTARMFEAKLASFQFVFSAQALIKAIIYYGIIFVVIMIFNTFTIGRQKLIDLIYADRKNEKFKSPHLVLSVFLFVISVVCLGAAYMIILENGIYIINTKFWISIILGCIGTFLFFFSLSGFFLKLISQSKRIYLKNLNMFVLRQINSKINTAYISMTFVCIMLFISICTLSSGMGIANATQSELYELTPFDASYTINVWEDIYDEKGEFIDSKPFDIDIIESIKKQEIDINSFAKEFIEVDYYNNSQVSFRFTQSDGDIIYSPDFIKLSEYNKILSMQGIESISLGPNEYAISSNMTALNWQNILKEYIEDESEIEINGEKYYTNAEKIYQYTIQISYSKDDFFIIVPDNALKNIPVRANVLHINYLKDTDEYEELCSNALLSIERSDGGPRDSGYGYSRSLQTKMKIFETSRITSTTISYLAIYIGIVFLITSAAVLAIAQLSEASDNIARYGLLRKIGTETKMINNALFMQILVYFGVPLFLALIHSVIGITVASDVVQLFGKLNILKDSVFAAVVITVIYGGYFIATYLGSKNIVNK